MKKYYIPSAMVIAILVAGALITSQVSAHGLGMSDGFAARFADHFGVNVADVESFMEEMHKEHHEQREALLQQHLDTAVSDGKLTQAQRDELLAMHESVQLSLSDATAQERVSQMKEHHEEMRLWAEENTIDLHEIMQFMPRRNGHMMNNR